MNAESIKTLFRKQYLILWLFLFLFLGIGIFSKKVSQMIDDLEFKTIDLRFQNRGKLPISDQVVIVDLDDRTLALKPSLLEKRTELAQLILKLQPAKVIAIDLLFKSPEEILDAHLKEKIDLFLKSNQQTTPDQASTLLQEIYQTLLGDQQLENAFQTNQIVLAYKFDQIGITTQSNQNSTQNSPSSLHKGRFATTAIKTDQDRKSLKIVDQPLLSLPIFQKKAKALGFVNVPLDADGILRSINPIYQYQNQEYSAFAIQAVLLYKGLNKSHLHYDLNENRLMMKKEVWTFPNQEWLINYRGPAKTIPTYSAVDILNDSLPTSLWKDRLVVISKSFLFKDRIHTPIDPLMSGGEIQATLMDQLIKGDALQKLSASEELGICLLFIIISAIDLIYLRRLNGFILIMILWFSYLSFCMIAFKNQSLILPMVKPSLSLILIWSIGISYRLLSELEIKAKIKESFGKYISKDVLSVLLKDDRFEIKNEVAEITILFSDIRSFTKYSENRSAQDLAILLNQYFDPMTKAVLDHQGLVDKYIGDAIMAFFGMPVQYPNHRDRALDAVIDMHKALIRLQPTFDKAQWTLKIGIGLNTGEALVGNLGSSERFNYTAIGDSVNLASRIESLSSTYQLFCIVGENTRKKANDRFLFREIDLVKVKGKDEAIALFEFLGDSQSVIIQYQAMDVFEKGMLCFRQGKLDESQALFEAFLELNRNDRVSEIYLERIEKMKLEGGVPDGWMGVVQYQAKS
jgi:adenylate cyclase